MKTIQEYAADKIYPEYTKLSFKYYESDIDYLNKKFKNCLRLEKSGKNINIDNRQFVGTIKLPSGQNPRYVPKIDNTNFFAMIEYVYSKSIDFSRKKILFADPEISVKISEGIDFSSILLDMFLNELERIRRMGLYKSYINTEDNQYYLKGKLLIGKHITKNPTHSKFFCGFSDFTYNNVENQIILYAADKLIRKISQKNKLRSKLIFYMSLLKDNIDLIPYVNVNIIENLNINRLNQHYSGILELSKIIIKDNNYGTTHEGNILACNFLIDMNSLFEKFIYCIVNDVISSEPLLSDFYATEQESNKNLVEERKLTLRPDIVIKNKSDNEVVVILDSKYKNLEKKGISSSDYYQAIAYCLASSQANKSMKNVDCALMALNNENSQDTYIIDMDKFSEGNKLGKINIYTIGLSFKSGNDFIPSVKTQIKETLFKIMNITF